MRWVYLPVRWRRKSQQARAVRLLVFFSAALQVVCSALFWATLLLRTLVYTPHITYDVYQAPNPRNPRNPATLKSPKPQPTLNLHPKS